MKHISSHTFLIAQYFAHHLMKLSHSNGAPLARVYAENDFNDPRTQGPIVNFSLLRANGDYIGFAEVDKLAQLHDIHLRTGCFCNTGACQQFLHISSSTIKDNLQAGHVCGDDKDLIDGRPTGSIRISFGYMSSIADAVRCLDFLAECFLELSPKPVFVTPDWFLPPQNVVDASEKMVVESQSGGVTSDKAVMGLLGKKIHEAEGTWREDVDASVKTSSASSLGKKNGTSEEALRKDVDGSGKMLRAERTRREDDEAKDGGDGEEGERSGEVSGERLEGSEKHRVLTDIFLYPVKSCGAFRVEEWELGERGLLYDRTWMIVTENGVALSQKREPRLCLLRPIVHLRSATLELTFPGMSSYCVPLDMDDVEEASDVSICTNKICNDRVRSRDCGQGVAQWVSQALERPGLRLLRQLDQDGRQTRRKDLGDEGPQSSTITTVTATTTTAAANTSTTTTTTSSGSRSLSLANESQYLVICRESVRSLVKKLTETQEDVHTELKDHPDSLAGHPDYLGEDNLVERFRANLVIDGGLPFDEDHWTRMRCGDVDFVGQGQCSRCGMICLNQSTGEKTREPLRTLASWRGGKVYFGVYMRKLHTESRPLLRVGSIIIAD